MLSLSRTHTYTQTISLANSLRLTSGQLYFLFQTTTPWLLDSPSSPPSSYHLYFFLYSSFLVSSLILSLLLPLIISNFFLHVHNLFYVLLISSFSYPTITGHIQLFRLLYFHVTVNFFSSLLNSLFSSPFLSSPDNSSLHILSPFNFIPPILFPFLSFQISSTSMLFTIFCYNNSPEFPGTAPFTYTKSRTGSI